MKNAPAIHSPNPIRILVVAPSWIGDIVMAHSLLQILKQRHPHSEIHVLAPEWSHSLLSRMPEIHQCIVNPLGHGTLGLRKRYSLGKSLREHHYDQAIVLPNSFKSALIPWFARIKKRTGWLGEYRWGLLNDYRILNKEILSLMFERFAVLGLSPDHPLPSPLPVPYLTTHAQQVEKVLHAYGLKNNKPILGLCPGAAFGPAKRWPSHYYRRVAEEKLKQGWQVWIFGSKEDGPIAKAIQSQLDIVDLTGRTSLADAIDLLSLTQEIVTNDSGLMHIAAALNRPLVALYGSTTPTFTPPLSEKARVLQLELPCRPCFKRVCPLNHLKCLTQLTPDTVLQTLNKYQQ